MLDTISFEVICKSVIFKLQKMNICRLCLDVIVGNSTKLLDNVYETVQILVPELNLTVSASPLLCSMCYNTLNELWRFKTASLEIEEKIKSKNDQFNNFAVEPSNTKMKNRFCRTCLTAIECESFTVLKPSEPDYYLKNMFLTCLPEIDLDVTKEPVMCEKCLENLQKLHHFRSSCLNVEERIRSYTELHGSNSSNQVSLSSVFESGTNQIKTEFSDFSLVEVKAELGEDSDVKREIEDESSDDTFNEDESSSEDYFVETKEDGKSWKKKCDQTEKVMFSCSLPSKDTKKESECSRKHNGQTHKCKKCNYTTQCSPSFKLHLKLAHGDVKYFFCGKCGLHTKYKGNLIQHMRKVHEGKVTIYNCPSCEFSTIHKGSFNAHTLANHAENPTWYQCPKCDYKTKHKRWIKPHVLKVHDKVVKVLKCKLCKYETKNRENLANHVRFDHDGAELLKCNNCDYMTRLKSNLMKHIKFTHVANLPMHSCPYCLHETKRKDDLKKHINKIHSNL